jgi:PAS domain S-box-containing protein
MKRFVKRALEKLEKMDTEKIRAILWDLSSDNEVFQMVLDSMTDGVVVTNTENRVLMFNKSSERLVPFTACELTDKLLWEVVEDEEIAGFIRDKLQRQETVRDREFVMENGADRIVAYSIMPLVSGGSIQGNLLHLEDVTEKKAKEARLRRAESLAALTTLAAGVAHEIKNPLGSISIHIQLMQKEMQGKETVPTAKFREYLDVINEEVDRLNTTVVDFLFAVRPMDAKLTGQDINQIIQDLIDFLKFELEKANVGLELNLREVPEIQVDEKYIKHALINLIKNALDAMPDGGILTVSTSYREGSVVVEVADTGVGIAEEDVTKIFEPYFTTKDFSSGLGLTLVFKIIKEHNGEISLRSKEGEGTTFTLTFPVPQGEKKLIGFEGGRNEI